MDEPIAQPGADPSLLRAAVEDALNAFLPKARPTQLKEQNEQQYRLRHTCLSKLVLARHSEELDTRTQDPEVCRQYEQRTLQRKWRKVAAERFKNFEPPVQSEEHLSRLLPLAPYSLHSLSALENNKRSASSPPRSAHTKKIKTHSEQRKGAAEIRLGAETAGATQGTGMAKAMGASDAKGTGDATEMAEKTDMTDASLERPAKLSRKEKKYIRTLAHRSQRFNPNNSQVFHAEELDLRHLRISSTGWKGIDATSSQRDPLTKLLKQRDRTIFEILAQFHRIPFNAISEDAQLATRILDDKMRLFIYRSNRPHWVLGLLDELGQAAQVFVEATHVSEQARAGHSRGVHFFMIVGFDRNNKTVPVMSAWQRQEAHRQAVTALFECPAMSRVNGWVTALVREHFSEIASRMEDSVRINCKKYGMEPSDAYGLFWNFCLNAPFGPIRNVFCKPHTDSKNGAILVCAVFVYYYGKRRGNADERIWLVFWEAGLIIQVPVGVVIIYPSALFLHFNVDIEEVMVVTEGGSLPTPDNTVPFGQDNDMEGGRASMVWFTQATMLQSAELPTDTVQEMKELEAMAKKQGRTAAGSFYDAQGALAAGMFPFNR